MTDPAPQLDLDLDLPPVERYATLDDGAVARGRALLEAVLDELPGAALHLAHLLRLRTRGRFQADLRAIGQRFSVDWKRVALASVSYDLTLAAIGCSTVALAGPRGPVVARNLDWWPEEPLARATCLVRELSGGTCVRATAGWPGSLGVVTGLSSQGFALVLNAVSGPEGVSLTGYPVLLHLRRVLEDATSFDDALARLRDTRLAAPCLITLVGRENSQRVVIERSPRRHALRWATGDAPLVVTNDYRALHPPQARAGSPIYETTCSRYDALTVLGAELSPADAPTDRELLAILTDPEVVQSITVQHVVMRPYADTINVWTPSRFAEDRS